MKLIFAGDTGLYDATAYNYFIYNCNRNKCQERYTVPIPDLGKLQFFVYFGQSKPVTVAFELVSTCSTPIAGAITAQDYVIGQLPNGLWYGVFKNFLPPAEVDPTCFVITAVFTFEDLSEIRYFSEEICIELCGDLMEIKACFPDKATTMGFDMNRIYYGFHNGDAVDALGDIAIRYFHKYYVRQAYILNTGKKTTFKNYLSRNFRTVIELLYQLRTELVPDWYSNYLIAAFSRGEIIVRETMSMAAKKWTLSETNFELVEEDGKLWKPVVTLLETIKQFFGCDECINAEAACTGNATNVLIAHIGPIYVFTFAGSVALVAGESLQYEVREKESGVLIEAGQLDADPLTFSISSVSYKPDEKCYRIKWRKVCATDMGSFSLDYSDDFEVGGAAGAFSEWVYKEDGLCAGTPAIQVCKTFQFEVFGSGGSEYTVTAVLCDGSGYDTGIRTVADGAPLPICAREGSVVITGNVSISSSSEDCNTGEGNVNFEDCDKGTSISAIKFNDVPATISGGMPIIEGDTRDVTIYNGALDGTLQITIADFSGGVDTRIVVEDSDGNISCLPISANGVYNFNHFDVVPGEPISIEIRCGGNCE